MHEVPHRTVHEQVTFTVGNRTITCDRQIEHIMRGLNEISGVETTVSCWNVLDRHVGGYVVIKSRAKEFIDYLRANQHGFQVDDPYRGEVHININPNYSEEIEREQKDELLRQAWDNFLAIANGFKMNV